MKKAFFVACLFLVLLVVAGCGDDDPTFFVDTTPTAFSFTNQSSVALSTPVTSNVITVAGINFAAAISVTGGTYSVDGGAFIALDGTVNNGQTVAVRHTSAATSNTATNTTLTIGGVSDTFTSVTVPIAFGFTSQTGVALSTLVTSNTITIATLAAPAAISVVGGTYSINGGAFTAAAGTVANGDTVAVQHTSAATVSTNTVTTLTIAGVQGTFTSTTTATPAFTFSFTPQTGVPLDSVIQSNTITITGLPVSPATISVTGGEYSINGGVFETVDGTIANGDTLQVQHTSSALENTLTTTTVTIGGVDGTFTSTTLSSALGQTVYTASCAGCHSLGTFDPEVGGELGPDLSGQGALLSPTGPPLVIPSVPGHVVINLTTAEISSLTLFLDLN